MFEQSDFEAACRDAGLGFAYEPEGITGRGLVVATR